MNELELAKYINTSQPLNRYRISDEIKEMISHLDAKQKINLLVFSFRNYDKNYNKELCLTYTTLWNELEESDWKKLIIDMFPRDVEFIKGNLKEINTSSYFDVFLLNGIIGVSPFEFIFNEARINEEQKRSFINYLKFYGNDSFFYNEREMIEDIVNFYELGVFSDIVKMKEKLILCQCFNTQVCPIDLDKKVMDMINDRSLIREIPQNIIDSETEQVISYSIISRGEMIITYNNNTVNFSIKVTGELIFQPSTFYADLSVFEREVNLSEDVKKHIINFIENDSEKTIGTKIIFD
ncbi:hypothetical protein [Paenimyroides aestuarii]|uniref:Uncharacterized protein n=1 Tax=Paenimyroides aestuarii TaxID=2968490 RepID=A0ABY5NPL9_9FLAO|nr:hypothetical protein [Paenimyroides aestuarii]UUV20443.1 hypothetical protein NPX36_08685 [Paenimyroides aestuarii]